jgi:TonB family protein
MRPHCYPLVFFGFLVIGLACFPAQGQDLSEIQRLAAQTSERVAKERPNHVFFEIGNDCIFDTLLCKTLESNFRVELTKLIPAVQFVSRETFLQTLRRRGFLSIDADDDLLAIEFASEIGAEIVVEGDLKIEAHSYELSSNIFKISANKKIGTFKTKVARSASVDDARPILIRDEESGVTFPIYLENALHFPPVYIPHCMICPDPVYPEEARLKKLQGVMAFLVTITVQGTAEQISLVHSFDTRLTGNAIQTIHGWRFKPAIGPDGKPFVTRMPLEVTYRLPH